MACREPHGAYSLSFFEQKDGTPSAAWPPQVGKFIYATAFFDRTDRVCLDYSARLDEHEPLDFWALSFMTSDAEPGVYPVTFNVRFPAAAPGSSVYFDHWQEGRRATRHTAVGGQVELLAAETDPARWPDAGDLRARLTLDFLAHNVETIVCKGSMSMGRITGASCDCRAEDGTTFTCDVKPGEADCCRSSDGAPLWTTELELTATACPNACVTYVALASTCPAIQGN